MVVGTEELTFHGTLPPLQLTEGAPVIVQERGAGFSKGILHLFEEAAEEVEVRPRLDMNQQPMGKPFPLRCSEMIGKIIVNAEEERKIGTIHEADRAREVPAIRIFRRSA